MDDRILLGWIVGIIMGLVLSGFIHSKFEADVCTELEKKIGHNLAYTYSTGCVLPEDL